MDPSAFIFNKNDNLISENTFHSDDMIQMAGKEIGVDIQKDKNFKYSQSHKLPSCESIQKKLNPNDFGWMEMTPEHLDMLTRFHPLNETSHVVEKRSSSSVIDKVTNSMSACSLGYGAEEGGICTKLTKRGMGRGRGRRKNIPEDDTFITRQMLKYLGNDYVQPSPTCPLLE